MSGQSVDPVDTMLDLTEFEPVSQHYSPAMSPANSQKSAFVARPASQASTPLMPQMSQMSGPSHQYELYKQQTGIVPGAMASALASINPSMNFGTNMDMDYLDTMPTNPMFDFNNAPSQAMDTNGLDIDFQSQADGFFFENAMAPSVDGSASLASQPVVPSQNGNIRYYPGMHKQAAMMKEQQQRQRQQMEMQRQQQASPSTRPRSKSNQPTDPIIEQKITQLLNSMRAKPSTESVAPTTSINMPKAKKDEEDMDEDERLLASEEGKKLSSKERRQLRNKVSARAFRSRRKEYISHLESEISAKLSENGDLRAQNRALMEENKRLSDLTRMLLSSPSFNNFLDTLSANAMAAESQAMQQQQQQQQPIKQEPRQGHKDVNPYAASVHSQQQQPLGMPMIPEQPVEFNMIQYEPSDASSFIQAQVFAVTAIPDEAKFAAEALSGKESNFIDSASYNAKIEAPVVEREEKIMAPEVPSAPCSEIDNDPEFALFNNTDPATSAPTPKRDIDIFGGIESEKVLARFEFVDASEDERFATLSMARIEHISDLLEARMESLMLFASDEPVPLL